VVLLVVHVGRMEYPFSSSLSSLYARIRRESELSALVSVIVAVFIFPAGMTMLPDKPLNARGVSSSSIMVALKE
jgi:hypothetical protein